MKRTAIEGPEIRLTLRVPADVWTRIRVLAAKEGSSGMAVTNRLLAEGVEREEKKANGRGNQ